VREPTALGMSFFMETGAPQIRFPDVFMKFAPTCSQFVLQNITNLIEVPMGNSREQSSLMGSFYCGVANAL